MVHEGIWNEDVLRTCLKTINGSRKQIFMLICLFCHVGNYTMF